MLQTEKKKELSYKSPTVDDGSTGTLGHFNMKGNKAVQYFGGMRPGCWINVIPAGDIVLAPTGSTGCTCNYLNESWLALWPVRDSMEYAAQINGREL